MIPFNKTILSLCVSGLALIAPLQASAQTASTSSSAATTATTTATTIAITTSIIASNNADAAARRRAAMLASQRAQMSQASAVATMENGDVSGYNLEPQSFSAYALPEDRDSGSSPYMVATPNTAYRFGN